MEFNIKIEVDGTIDTIGQGLSKGEASTWILHLADELTSGEFAVFTRGIGWDVNADVNYDDFLEYIYKQKWIEYVPCRLRYGDGFILIEENEW